MNSVLHVPHYDVSKQALVEPLAYLKVETSDSEPYPGLSLWVNSSGPTLMLGGVAIPPNPNPKRSTAMMNLTTPGDHYIGPGYTELTLTPDYYVEYPNLGVFNNSTPHAITFHGPDDAADNLYYIRVTFDLYHGPSLKYLRYLTIHKTLKVVAQAPIRSTTADSADIFTVSISTIIEARAGEIIGAMIIPDESIFWEEYAEPKPNKMKIYGYNMTVELMGLV
jgi:hypothetical protein